MLNAFHEEEFYGFVFREYKDLGEPSILMVSLPDVGLVGSIAGVHMIRELKLTDAVGIDSYSAFPPVVVVHGGEPKHPMRVYSGDGLAILVTDVPVPPPAIAPLSKAIVEWAARRGIRTILGVTGLGNPGRIDMEKPGLYYLATTEKSRAMAEKVDDAKRLSDGILVGPMALILKEAVRMRLNVLMLMVDSYIDLPDPEAAARAVDAVSKIIGREVSVEKLMKEAEMIKLRYRELMKETRSMMAKMGKGYEYRAPLLYT